MNCWLRGASFARCIGEPQSLIQMDNNYLLPVCFAVAAHGALLFGFTKHPRPVASVKDDTVLTCFHFTPPEEERPVIVDPEQSETAPKLPPDAPLPRQPERLSLAVGETPTMTPPRLPPVS